MLKSNLLRALILSFFYISLKSIPVPCPENIEWWAQPKDFVISLFKEVLGRQPIIPEV